MRQHPLRTRKLSAACEDLRYLLNQAYPKESALRFVGDHYQLHQMERDVLYRGVFSRAQVEGRRLKCVGVRAMRGDELVIDAHNVLITLESALKGRPILLADDGFVRDVSRVFRRYRPSEDTKRVWAHIERLLKTYPPKRITLLLDAPLPKSGELASRINVWLREAGLTGEARTVARHESAFLALAGIKVTADSALVDRSSRVFDLAGHIIRRRMHMNLLRLS